MLKDKNGISRTQLHQSNRTDVYPSIIPYFNTIIKLLYHNLLNSFSIFIFIIFYTNTYSIFFPYNIHTSDPNYYSSYNSFHIYIYSFTQLSTHSSHYKLYSSPASSSSFPFFLLPFLPPPLSVITLPLPPSSILRLL